VKALYQSRERAAEAADKLKVYAHPLRLMILSRLLAGEAAVGEIDKATGIGQPALSQQLAELRRAGLVQTRRVARQVHYRLADEGAIRCVRCIEAMLDGQAEAGTSAPAPAERSSFHTPEPGAAAFARILD